MKKRTLLVSMTEFIMGHHNINLSEVVGYARIMSHEMSDEIFVGFEEQVLFDGFKIQDPKDHGVATLGSTSFITHVKSGFNIAHKKEWENEWEFYFNNVEEMFLSFKNECIGEEIYLSDNAVKSLEND